MSQRIVSKSFCSAHKLRDFLGDEPFSGNSPKIAAGGKQTYFQEVLELDWRADTRLVIYIGSGGRYPHNYFDECDHLIKMARMKIGTNMDLIPHHFRLLLLSHRFIQ